MKSQPHPADHTAALHSRPRTLPKSRPRSAVPKNEFHRCAPFLPWPLSAEVDRAVQAIQAFEVKMHLFPNVPPVPSGFRRARADDKSLGRIRGAACPTEAE